MDVGYASNRAHGKQPQVGAGLIPKTGCPLGGLGEGKGAEELPTEEADPKEPAFYAIYGTDGLDGVYVGCSSAKLVMADCGRARYVRGTHFGHLTAWLRSQGRSREGTALRDARVFTGAPYYLVFHGFDIYEESDPIPLPGWLEMRAVVQAFASKEEAHREIEKVRSDLVAQEARLQEDKKKLSKDLKALRAAQGSKKTGGSKANATSVAAASDSASVPSADADGPTMGRGARTASKKRKTGEST